MSKESYKKRFLKDNIEPGTAFSQTVPIHPNLMRLIKTIIHSADNPSLTVKGFVNNLLAEHFKEHEEEIRDLYVESTSKLNLL